MIGQTIGNYRVTDLLGEGGVGAVYRAEHTMVGHAVALKVLLPQWSRNQGVIKRFFNEARAATRIQHRGIPEVYDCGVNGDGRAWIAMQLLEGETLGALLGKQARLPVAEAIELARQIADILGAAHASNIVHRDLKPDNIFLVRDPSLPGGRRVVLLDFGIAKLAPEDGGAATRTGIIMGTPDYMAPEQCMAAKRADHRADLYALGCILFHMIAGRVPFQGGGPGAIMAAHLGSPPPPLGKFARVPAGIDALVTRLMAKEPEGRCQSAAEVIAGLSGAAPVAQAARAPVPVAVPPPAAPAPAPPDAETFKPNFESGPYVPALPHLAPGADKEPAPHAGLAAARDQARKSIAPAIVLALIVVAALAMMIIGYIAYG